MPGKAAVAPKFLGNGKIVFRRAKNPLAQPRRTPPRSGHECDMWHRPPPVLRGVDGDPGPRGRRCSDWTRAGDPVKEGTPGVVFLMDYCGECRSCRIGFTNQCLAKRADMGFTHDGGYGPYEVVHESNFFPSTAMSTWPKRPCSST